MLTTAISTPLPLTAAPVDFFSGRQLLARWDGSRLHAQPGYACDGYTPVVRILGRWVHITPVPRCGLWPAVLHDLTRQFLGVDGCPWSRLDSDNWFFDAMVAGGLHPHHAGIYHGVVAGPIGSGWISLTRSVDPALRVVPAAYSRSVRNTTVTPF